MFVEQMEVGGFSVFAYLVGSESTGEALVIDPAGDQEMIVKTADKKKLKIKYIVNTHFHIDHIMGNRKMKEPDRRQDNHSRGGSRLSRQPVEPHDKHVRGGAVSGR